MCGFVGFSDFKNDVASQKNILLNMNIALGHKRLIVIDPERWQTAYD